MPAKTLFAPGQICYPDEAQAALHQAGLQGIALICRHLAGDWGDVDEKRRQVNRWVLTHKEDTRQPPIPIISRFSLPGDQQVLIITQNVYLPARRRTTLSLWSPAGNENERQLARKKRQVARKKRQLAGKKQQTPGKKQKQQPKSGRRQEVKP